VPLEGITVRLRQQKVVNGNLTLLYIDTYATTDSQGRFSFTYDSISTNWVHLDVIASNRRSNSTSTTLGAVNFQIKAGGGSPIVLRRKNFGVAPGTQVFDFQFNSEQFVSTMESETISAYRTAWEVFKMWEQQGTSPLSIKAHLEPLNIEVMASLGDLPYPVSSWGDVKGGMTPTSNTVMIGSPYARFSPWTLAHEMGHILTWNFFEIPLALISPTDYVTPLNPLNFSWDVDSIEGEKVSFHDAFGDLNLAMWMWYRAADPPTSETLAGVPSRSSNPRYPCDSSSNGCNLEVAGICARDSTPFPKRLVICNLRALWDVIDEPPNDIDGITNRSLNHVLNVLKSYGKHPVDHGAWEGYPYDAYTTITIDENSWFDYYHNHVAVYPQDKADLEIISEEYRLPNDWLEDLLP
jgi:hypothetical protein